MSWNKTFLGHQQNGSRAPRPFSPFGGCQVPVPKDERLLQPPRGGGASARPQSLFGSPSPTGPLAPPPVHPDRQTADDRPQLPPFSPPAPEYQDVAKQELIPFESKPKPKPEPPEPPVRGGAPQGEGECRCHDFEDSSAAEWRDDEETSPREPGHDYPPVSGGPGLPDKRPWQEDEEAAQEAGGETCVPEQAANTPVHEIKPQTGLRADTRAADGGEFVTTLPGPGTLTIRLEDGSTRTLTAEQEADGLTTGLLAIRG